MTELEFALSAFVADKTQGKRGVNWNGAEEEYRALRAMRYVYTRWHSLVQYLITARSLSPMLFLDNNLLASSQHTAGLPPLIVLHHILVRSPLPLPHTLHGWAEAEYVRWVDEHSDQEAYSLVEGDIVHWEKVAEAEGTDTSVASEYVQLARSVLANATKDGT